ncbi:MULTISPECIES: histidinol-phosphatase HisJ family protein [unclassified Breznakia]|uniref:histidinol-phosphatase HisJ family protein n=1 Tax=unclassified Breznakia TaxID=2623764 RepID=UPI0024737164|nr:MULTISPECIES: histidinol-phosphatase HisJ family protein [unclassified Breznakia]MDH6366860.1 histidinol-phosphatase (PHP family) [Breznakia sp. PH1-1]MDH6404038.1 histidinol-phosphatase (PHP family) [Breznakia sp. PF1-11]MDH6411740.1 histidinol-phosphatase (PHP family) [Breznakia sp. PFB1-11]MDH6414026.1 histidinol-phosphatase (PHP family) [Breznakia sp. PFB1-14]MDH6416456.1 histidinol-phosphatase (PHP family) [Breznakia sp. PFB1-4]
MNYIADFHIHSLFSNDSEERLENIIEQAKAKGVKEICFTEHVDYGVKFDHDDPEHPNVDSTQRNVDYPLYIKTLTQLQQDYKDDLTIRIGLEFGMQRHRIDTYQRLYDRLDLDFVILSCHEIDDKEFWTYDYQKGKDEDEMSMGYYEELYTLVNSYKDYSILGHLDHLERYIPNHYPFEKSKDIITKILKIVIADGKGIEVNTSSFAYKLPDLTPAREILELYYELGGTIITLGSDAHTANRIADHFEEVATILKEIGFSQYCTFEKMKPIFHAL